MTSLINLNRKISRGDKVSGVVSGGKERVAEYPP